MPNVLRNRTYERLLWAVVPWTGWFGFAYAPPRPLVPLQTPLLMDYRSLVLISLVFGFDIMAWIYHVALLVMTMFQEIGVPFARFLPIWMLRLILVMHSANVIVRRLEDSNLVLPTISIDHGKQVMYASIISFAMVVDGVVPRYSVGFLYLLLFPYLTFLMCDQPCGSSLLSLFFATWMPTTTCEPQPSTVKVFQSMNLGLGIVCAWYPEKDEPRNTQEWRVVGRTAQLVGVLGRLYFFGLV
jgi:hypothetical protein